MNRRRVTLTFDNGPDPAVTPIVLDELGRRGARCTFFVVGEQLQQSKGLAMARRAAAEGHWIGNHSLTHSIPLGEMADAAEIVREIEETQDLLGDLAHPDRLFRPFGNGGIIDERLLGPAGLRRLQDGGYTCVLWNSVPRDWEQPDTWVSTALEQVEAQEWSVMVLHDLDTGAMKHLPDLLDALESRDVELAQEFPEACLALKRGRPGPALSQVLPAADLDGGTDVND